MRCSRAVREGGEVSQMWVEGEKTQNGKEEPGHLNIFLNWKPWRPPCQIRFRNFSFFHQHFHLTKAPWNWCSSNTWNPKLIVVLGDNGDDLRDHLANCGFVHYLMYTSKKSFWRITPILNDNRRCVCVCFCFLCLILEMSFDMIYWSWNGFDARSFILKQINKAADTHRGELLMKRNTTARRWDGWWMGYRKRSRSWELIESSGRVILERQVYENDDRLWILVVVQREIPKSQEWQMNELILVKTWSRRRLRFLRWSTDVLQAPLSGRVTDENSNLPQFITRVKGH